MHACIHIFIHIVTINAVCVSHCHLSSNKIPFQDENNLTESHRELNKVNEGDQKEPKARERNEEK